MLLIRVKVRSATGFEDTHTHAHTQGRDRQNVVRCETENGDDGAEGRKGFYVYIFLFFTLRWGSVMLFFDVLLLVTASRACGWVYMRCVVPCLDGRRGVQDGKQQGSRTASCGNTIITPVAMNYAFGDLRLESVYLLSFWLSRAIANHESHTNQRGDVTAHWIILYLTLATSPGLALGALVNNVAFLPVEIVLGRSRCSSLGNCLIPECGSAIQESTVRGRPWALLSRVPRR